MSYFVYKFSRARLDAILSSEIGSIRPPFLSTSEDDDYDIMYQSIIYEQYLRCLAIQDKLPYFDSKIYDEIMSETQAFEDAIEVCCAYCFQARELFVDDYEHKICDSALAHAASTKYCASYSCT